AHRRRAPHPSGSSARSCGQAGCIAHVLLLRLSAAANSRYGPFRDSRAVYGAAAPASPGATLPPSRRDGHRARKPTAGHGPRIMRDEQFLTTEEVMDYLQVNLRTIYRLIKAGRIPAVRVGRQWRFHKKDIDAWLDENRTTAP